jgi:hypothetical protein
MPWLVAFCTIIFPGLLVLVMILDCFDLTVVSRSRNSKRTSQAEQKIR